MNNLPTELLHNIFILLPVIQKKECMHVCRRWTSVIQQRSLLHTVYIDNINTFHKFLLLLKDRPELVLQVEYLTLFSCMIDDSDKSILTVFPNLKAISMSSQSGLLKSSATYTFNPQELHWKTGSLNRIQYIQDFYECGLTRLLLSHGLCSRLITLHLKIGTADTSPSDLFQLLKDMPVLKTLIIDHSPLKIDTMEVLHNNIPSLQTLKLLGVDLLGGIVPTNINPAIALTRLYVWTYDHDFQGKTNWLQYICKKYTHLEHFNYEWDPITYCRELKDVYSAEYMPLLQRIGSQLKSLTLSGTMDRNHTVLKSLDDFGCHVTDLELDVSEDGDAFGILAQTKQFKQIERLSLNKLDVDQDFDKLKDMEKLKSLTLNFDECDPFFVFDDDEKEEIENYIKDVTINLNELFRLFPKHVTSVCISTSYVDFDDDTKLEQQQQQQQQQYSHIETLTLGNMKPHKKMDLFISNCFPNLHSLSLMDCFEKDQTFVLQNHHFSYLELSKSYSAEFNVSLVTTDGHKPCFYNTSTKLKKAHSDLDKLLLPILQDDLIGDRNITVNCGSVKNLVLNHKKAYLISDKYEFQSLIK